VAQGTKVPERREDVLRGMERTKFTYESFLSVMRKSGGKCRAEVVEPGDAPSQTLSERRAVGAGADAGYRRRRSGRGCDAVAKAKR